MPTEQERADVSHSRGVTAAHIPDPAERRNYIAAQGTAESKGQDKSPELKQQDEGKRNILAATGLMGGNQPVSTRSMKGQALLGRNSNMAIKKAFKKGPVCTED